MISDAETEFRNRVEACVAFFLNKNYPGWVDEIQLGLLNLMEGCQCVLGQLAVARGTTYLMELFKHAVPHRAHELTSGVVAIPLTKLEQMEMKKLQAQCAFATDDLVTWDLATEIWREKIAALRLNRKPLDEALSLV